MRLAMFKSRARQRAGMAAAARRRRGGRARYGKGAIKGFSKAQTNSIRRLIAKKEETKYWAKQLLQNQILDGAIHTPGMDQIPLVPNLVKGTDDYQRVGRSVIPTKCRVDIVATFPQVLQGNVVPSTMNNAAELYVAIYILRSKVLKNWETYKNSTEYLALLDNGQGESTPFGYIQSAGGVTPFWTANTAYLQMPVEQSHFTLLKKKIVKLVRNTGGMFDGVGTATNSLASSFKGSFTYRLPKLIYDDSTTVTNPTAFPTNTNVFMAIGYAYANNLDSAVSIEGVENEDADRLSVTVRNHVWYKDA